MLPIKKILCPTDFSEPSYEAVKTANELALHFSAELILVHVVNPIHFIPTPDPGVGIYATPYEQEMEDLAKKKLNEVVQEKIPEGVKLSTLIVHGNPAGKIVQAADDENTDIIVIATHGLTGWRHMVFGSVAERVVQHAPCAVLTVRAKDSESGELKDAA